MTPLVWATIALCAVVASLIVGIPYWITFARPGGTPDHSEARAYLAAKERAVEGVMPAQTGPDARHRSAGTAPIGWPRTVAEEPVRRAA
ncbi:MAG TPA: hypothetical protein VEH31_20385 [Streptosporangiaceae bacterium]|nr:hypothetical protein [Streptosporangiaceae bacterium]